MTQSQKINIAVCDDHEVVVHGLVLLLNAMGFNVAITASNGRDLIDKLSIASSPSPDVCLLDVNMPEMNGLTTLQIMHTKWPSIKVLVLSLADNENIIAKMLYEGACGYLVKSCKAEDLKTAIESVHNNGVYFSEKVSRQIWGALRSDLKKELHLSEWEIEVMRACCSEKSYKEIADTLHVSMGSIKGAVDNIYLKLGIRNRSGMILFAIKNGIFILPSDIDTGAEIFKN
jgi:DNA-binding NarL/FixJ family response regulator